MTIAKIRTFILRHNLLKFLFFGNYFYALCAVALSLESRSILGLSTVDPHYLLILFMGVIVFYTHAYRSLDKTDEASVFQNPFYVQRTLWYIRNGRQVRVQQFLLAATIIITAVYYYWPILNGGIITAREYIAMGLVVLLALAYIGPGSLNIRRYGLLKPLVIALLWSALVSWFPVMTSLWANGQHLQIQPAFVWLFFYNTIYILLLCILFDIKDYAVDARSRLRTFVVWLGLRRTIHFVIMPLYVATLLGWYILARTLDYTIYQLVLGYVPLAALGWVIYKLRSPQPLLFYLFIVDGLMLLKAVIGIIISKL